MVKRRGPQYN